MRSTVIKLSFIGLFLGAFGAYIFTGSSVNASEFGPPASRTGAPAVGSVSAELNCTTSGCHTGSGLNQPGGTLAITTSSPTYYPGQEITVTVTLTFAGRSKFGFQLTPVNSQGTRAGTLTATDNRTFTQVATSGSQAGRQYINHNSAGTPQVEPGKGIWSFKWTAPASNVGAVTFYAAGNATNSSSTQSGDLIYTTSLTLQYAPPPVGSFSAASYDQPPVLTRNMIVAAFGINMTPNTVSATPGQTLPTQLDGTEVEIRDSAGIARNASLFFVSAGQINYLVPSDVAYGPATVSVKRSGNVVAQGSSTIAQTAPGLFTQNQDGQGVASSYILRYKQDNSVTSEFVFQLNQSTGKFEPKPFSMGTATDRVFLVLFGTGFRERTSLSATSCSIGGTELPVGFAGPSPDYIGLDQANIELPRSLVGRGTVDVIFKVDGKSARPVTIAVQ